MIKTIITGVYEQPDGRVQIAAVFVDENAGRKFEREVTVPASSTLEYVDAQLREKRDEKEAPASLLKLLQTGERDIDASIPVVHEPTAEEIAKSDYLRDRARLFEMQQEIDLKVRQPDNSEYQKLLAKVTSAVDTGIADTNISAEVTK